MIEIVKLKGGLGNQMFQYAFFLSLKKHHPLRLFLIDNNEALQCIHGIMIDEVFDVKMKKKSKWFIFFHNNLPFILRKANHIVQINDLQYNKKYFSERGLITIYDGYWQSEKYFIQIADKILYSFRFNEKKMNEQTLDLAKKIKSGNYASVHIRRGDYIPLADYHGLCSEEYYQNAMHTIREKYPNIVFVFFSDDIEWVQKHLKEEGAIYVDWNKGKDCWQDMYLMSCCKHNIVANSSFSWWGAWLNRNPRKVVIAPSQWFKFTPNYDIIPNNWLLL